MSKSILKISEAASLALHASVVLAANPQHSLAVGAIASALEASEAHLSKVLQDLAKEGIVKSVRGPKGGFALARPADTVTLLDVYEAIEGPLMPENPCISLHRPSFCVGNQCILGVLNQSVNAQVRQYLADTVLAQLTSPFAGVKVG